MQVLVFLDEINHTSIPFEISTRIAAITDVEISICSFYDESPEKIDLIEKVEHLPVQIRCLGGRSRLDREAWAHFQREISQDYDLVHVHHNFSGSIARILAKQQGIPVIDTEHRDHNSFSLLQNLINGITLPLADRVVSNSQVTKDSFQWYERLLLNDKAFKVVHNGVNIERIQTLVGETPRSDDESTFRICTVGRMVPVKNQSTLLRAFSSVVERHPSAELLLVGDGPLRKDLELLAHELEIAGKVRFTGEVPRNRVYELYAQSDLFVIPSFAEGFCVAAVEAMAAGLPVVVSDIPIFHEVINKCGSYADPEKPELFAEKIQELLKNKDLRQERSSVCRARAQSEFSLEKTAIDYSNIYKEVVEGTTQ